MPSPFPGMDPYLEGPELWPDVHHSLISAIRAQLTPQLRPKYVARVEERVYVSEEGDPGRRALIPDVHVLATQGGPAAPAISGKGAGVDVAEPVPVVELIEQEMRELRIEIRSVADREVVAVIEVLSPANKIRGARGREEYEAKRRPVMRSPAHLIEVDLLREGDPVFVGHAMPPHDYGVYVSRAVEGGRERRGLFWPVRLRQKLPTIPVPLRGDDPDVRVDLQAALNEVYDEAAYDAVVDYTKGPDVELPGDSGRWADELLRSKGLK